MAEPTICGGCNETIHRVDATRWVVYADTVDGRSGQVLHRTYVYDCGDERQSHFPKEFSDDELVPKRVGHPSNEPVSAKSVRSGYANMVRGIQRANLLLPEEDRFHVPFGVQEAIITYIEEREAIESLTERRT